MWVYFLIFLIGWLVGFGVTWLCLRKKLKVTEQLNQDIVQQNKDAEQMNYDLQQQSEWLKKEINEKSNQVKAISEAMEHNQKQAAMLADNYYKEQMAIAKERASFREQELQDNYDKLCDQFSEKCANDQVEYLNEYRKTLEESVAEFQFIINKKAQELNALNYAIEDAKSKVEAAVTANKRAAEEQNKINFYRIQLSDIDIEEIKKLRAVIPYLREAEPLNKVIWKIYYERPTTDLIGRVIGGGVHTGIYKITNIENGMCYVGQAVNLAERWKQHIKRGVGADTPTRNKLYPAMLAVGVENFTFEVIEECERNQLDSREDYWQDFFKAREFGYSIK